MNKKIILPFITAIFTLCSWPVSSFAAELIYIPLPIEDQETVIASHSPMVNYLASKLGVSIKIRYEKEYQQILQLFKEGKADIIQLGPLPYATLKKEYPQALPLAIINEADGKPDYTCALVTAFDGPQSVAEIQPPLALPQALSTCGEFSAKLLLGHKPGFEQWEYKYLGNHSQVALAVIRGELKAGVMKTSVAKKYQNIALKVLQETPPVPGLVMVGNGATLNPEQIKQIGQLLVDADAQTTTTWIVGHDGFSAVSVQDFDLFFHSLQSGY